jgi:hypothetical protein
VRLTRRQRRLARAVQLVPDSDPKVANSLKQPDSEPWSRVRVEGFAWYESTKSFGAWLGTLYLLLETEFQRDSHVLAMNQRSIKLYHLHIYIIIPSNINQQRRPDIQSLPGTCRLPIVRPTLSRVVPYGSGS